MTTSGSFDWSVTIQQLITDALVDIGAIDAVAGPTDTESADGMRWLNYVLKALGKGTGIWLRQAFSMALVHETAAYTLSSATAGANWAATSDFVQTAIKTAGVSGAPTITVDSIAGIAALDKIGIELDDGTMQWTTVNGAPAGYVVTLGAALTDDVAVDNVVFAYTTKLYRPNDIIELTLVDSDGNETPIDLVSRQDYRGIPTKSSTGKPNQAFFETQLASPVLYLWPAPDDVSNHIKGTVKRPVEDCDTLTADLDVPPEWYLALMKRLGYELSGQYGCATMSRQQYKADMIEAWENAQWNDTEGGSIQFVPSRG